MAAKRPTAARVVVFKPNHDGVSCEHHKCLDFKVAARSLKKTFSPRYALLPGPGSVFPPLPIT